MSLNVSNDNTSQGWRRASSSLTYVFAIMLFAAVGCSKPSDQGATGLPADRGANDSLDLPTVTESPSEIRAEMKNYEDFSPEFEEARLRLLVAEHRIYEQQGLPEGFVNQVPTQHYAGGNAVIDPETGQLAWRAMTCFNPECTGEGKGGGPFLFVREFSNFQIGPDGKLLVLPFDASELERDPPRCPACGAAEFIRPYDSPETELRRRQLVSQLSAARGGGGNQNRSVKEIMVEMAHLPQIFLVPED